MWRDLSWQAQNLVAVLFWIAVAIMAVALVHDIVKGIRGY